MKMESLSFNEAVEKLAARAGVRIPVREEAVGPEQAERLKLKELLELAAATPPVSTILMMFTRAYSWAGFRLQAKRPPLWAR